MAVSVAVWLYTDLLQALKGERLSSVFSPDRTLISASAAPHCGRNQSKVIDTHVMSNHCDSCAEQKKKKTVAEFQEWYKGHEPNCGRNHNGSAGAMEPVGTQVIFRCSEELYKLRYLGFLGDGDSKAFSSVKNADPVLYEGVDIQKYECCGHVQKRMGRHLMNKVSQLKQTSFQYNGKTVKGTSGKVKLSNAAIRKIQGHYGAAIRNNVNNVDKMKKDIRDIWEHMTKKHNNCGSRYPSKKNQSCDQNQNALPPYITDAIKPVFKTLTDDTLLEKCAHGGTQNTNESFHNRI